MDREAWHAAVHGVAKSWTRLSDWTEWTQGLGVRNSADGRFQEAGRAEWRAWERPQGWTCRGKVRGGRAASLVSPGWLEVQSGLNTHRAPPVRSALSHEGPRPRRRAERQKLAGAGLQSRAPEARATQRRALSWLGPRGPQPTAGVTDAGSAAGALLPPTWSVGTPRGRNSAGAWVSPAAVRQCRASWRREPGGGKGPEKGPLPKSGGQTEVESGHPAPELGSSLSPLKSNVGGFPHWGAQESLSPTWGQRVWGSGHLPRRASGGGEHPAVMGSTQWWRAAHSSGREHSAVMGNTQRWWGALSSGGEHPAVVGSMQQ